MRPHRTRVGDRQGRAAGLTDPAASDGTTDRVGFEPTIPLPVYRFSRPAPSATRTPVLVVLNCLAGRSLHRAFPICQRWRDRLEKVVAGRGPDSPQRHRGHREKHKILVGVLFTPAVLCASVSPW